MDAREELEMWIDSFMDSLVRIAFSYVRSEANAADCVQNAFIKAYRSRNQLVDTNNPLPWLIRIVINESKMFLRKHRHEVISDVIPERISTSAEKEHLRQDTNRSIYAAVMDLPEKYRTPIILHYFEGLSHKEIGEIFGVNQATIRTRSARGRKLLKRSLEEVGHDEFGGRVTES